LSAFHELGLLRRGLGTSTPAAAQPAPAAASAVTFAKDIAPILQRSCQNCHTPEGVAPMSLVTYEDVRPWARSIKRRTGMGPRAGVMPPWFVEREIGIQRFAVTNASRAPPATSPPRPRRRCRRSARLAK